MRILPELLNSLDTDSYIEIEKRFLLFDLFSFIYMGYPYLVESEMILLSLYSQFNIHRYISHISLFYMTLLVSFFSCNLEYSNGRFFFFRLSFYLSEWKQGNLSLWYGLGLSLSFIFFCFFPYSGQIQTLYNIYRKLKWNFSYFFYSIKNPFIILI